MKKRCLLGCLAGLLFFQNLSAQTKPEASSFWHPGFSLSLSGGYSFFTRPNKMEAIAIPEVPFPASGLVWSFLDVNYTFRNHYGLRLLGRTTNARPAKENFRSSLEKNFPGYFISAVSVDFVHLSADQCLLGPSFSRFRGRFLFQPSLLFGFTEFNYRGAAAKAKAADSNQLYSLRFFPEQKEKWVYSPALLAGSKFGYFFSKRWSLYTSVDCTVLKHHLSYDYVKTDEIDQTTTSQSITFKSWQLAVTGQIGLSVLLGRGQL